MTWSEGRITQRFRRYDLIRAICMLGRKNHLNLLSKVGCDVLWDHSGHVGKPKARDYVIHLSLMVTVVAPGFPLTGRVNCFLPCMTAPVSSLWPTSLSTMHSHSHVTAVHFPAHYNHPSSFYQRAAFTLPLMQTACFSVSKLPVSKRRMTSLRRSHHTGYRLPEIWCIDLHSTTQFWHLLRVQESMHMGQCPPCRLWVALYSHARVWQEPRDPIYMPCPPRLWGMLSWVWYSMTFSVSSFRFSFSMGLIFFDELWVLVGFLLLKQALFIVTPYFASPRTLELPAKSV